MIEIIEYKAIDKPILKAQVSIRVAKWGGFIIKRINVFQKERTRWYAMPSEEYEQDGKKKYFTLCEFDSAALNDAFRKSFFEAYDNYVVNNLSSSAQQKTFPF